MHEHEQFNREVLPYVFMGDVMRWYVEKWRNNDLVAGAFANWLEGEFVRGNAETQNVMRAPDIVWNRAAEAWSPGSRAGFRLGDVALAGLLAFHSLAMNGGVLHALQLADDQMIREAVEGYRYFGFEDAAALVESGYVTSSVDSLAPSDAEELEWGLDRAYSEGIFSDQVLGEAFERHFAAHPDQYAP